MINSLASGRSGCNFVNAIFSHVLLICIFRSPYGNALRWIPWDLTGTKSTLILIQVMAWCCQATSHCLRQCWPSSLLPYGITGPQWFKRLCFKHISVIVISSTSCERTKDLTDDYSTLGQVIAWCHQATNNIYLSQCCLKFQDAIWHL